MSAANLFISSGVLARVIGKGGKETKAYNADPSKVVFNGPLVVVIDRSTSGAAEIIAAAVRDQKRGEVVGERSFGSGSEQEVYSLSDGGALLITTAKYAPMSGKPFMDEAVNPTVKVERVAEAEVILPDGNDDEEAPEEKVEPAQPNPVKTPEPPVEDVQLKKAFEILKQATAKGQAVQKRASVLKMPAPVGAVNEYEVGYVISQEINSDKRKSRFRRSRKRLFYFRSANRSALENILQDEPDIGRTLGQPPHEIRIPVLAIRHIHAHSVAFLYELLLQVAADAKKHLKLILVRRRFLSLPRTALVAAIIFSSCVAIP